ncbi:MAG: hypothetical protein HLUCCA05_02835 [Roseibaca calidilacus]|jgi:hypothetical protein|uniref:Uncharacterized protein n=1 Tax=Roseibaca calidilacus TaxID=1666912 RepID=A0A0P7YXF6_9RHOB|nr:hypothetical protein [Roseibaca calidilacus]KPP95614.1 MAG: hypothetical protein HLUCCA05_02835 [Roseibaca calidilacus]CUX82001.1 hypothetical protein Ga0058931_2106 [Roseibaca calidilacus]
MTTKCHMTTSGLAVAAALLALPAQAQEVTTETYALDGAQIILHLHPFLSEEGVQMLRLVGQNRDALSLFVADGARFAAMALAPDDGLVKDGLLAESAVAVSDLPDLDAARSAALEGCNAARRDGPECVIALEIQPE